MWPWAVLDATKERKLQCSVGIELNPVTWTQYWLWYPATPPLPISVRVNSLKKWNQNYISRTCQSCPIPRLNARNEKYSSYLNIYLNNFLRSYVYWYRSANFLIQWNCEKYYLKIIDIITQHNIGRKKWHELTAKRMETAVFWDCDGVPYGDGYQRFGGRCCPQLLSKHQSDTLSHARRWQFQKNNDVQNSWPTYSTKGYTFMRLL